MPEPTRYTNDYNVGIFVGMTFEPRVRFTYGIDLRLGTGLAVPFVRVEGHGVSAAKLGLGLQFVGNAVAAESGVAVRVGRDAGAVGAHLATGIWDPAGAVMAQGTLPLLGNRENYDVGLGFFLVPDEVPPLGFCGGGRPLRAHERFVLPLVHGVAAPTTAGALARFWAGAARLEHSSIWSFRRIAAELAAVGAPAGLVMRALHAAEDEARHAALCLRLAPGFELRSLDPASARPRFTARTTSALACLARETWLDGCLAEGMAAREAREAALVARDDTARATQQVIARDEADHAELSWAILSWIWAIAPADVRDGIAALVAQDGVPPARDGDASLDHDWLAAHGKPYQELSTRAWFVTAERARARSRALCG